MPLLRPLRRTTSSPPPPRALIVTQDDALLDELLRLAAIAGVEVQVAPDLASAGPGWTTAPLVLLDPDAVGGRRPNRRAGVHMVSVPPHDADVWQIAVSVGATSVLHLPRDDDALVQELAEAGDRGPSGLTVAIVGGRGGVGASSLCLALGQVAARRGAATLVADLDARGGGLDLAVGAEDDEGLRWDDVGPIEGRLSANTFVGQLPVAYGFSLLSCGRSGTPLPESAQAVVLAARKAFAAVVLDVPRDGSANHALVGADWGLVVASADVRGCAAAHAVACALEPSVSQVGVVVRTGTGAALSPDDVADAVGFPWVATLAHDALAAAAYERGEPPALRRRGPWRSSCTSILDRVGVVDQRVNVA